MHAKGAQNKGFDNNIDNKIDNKIPCNPKALFFAILKKSVMGSCPQETDIFLKWFDEYLRKRVSPKVRYEYMRIVSKFVCMHNTHIFGGLTVCSMCAKNRASRIVHKIEGLNFICTLFLPLSTSLGRS
jgi:hypothetical protein